MTKKKRKSINVKNKKSAGRKKTIKDYEQFYSKLYNTDNIDEMEKFLEHHKLSKQIQE